MKKIFWNIYLNKYKNIFYLLINSNSKYFEIKKIELRIKKNIKLGNKDSKITTKPDEIITPNILQNGEWEYFIIKFISKIVKNKKLKFDFIDIGANIGLTTIQLTHEKKIPINKYYCIEPERENFLLLKENLNHNKKVSFFNFALTNEKSKRKKIYKNRKNHGDYSLLKKSGNDFDFVKTKNINSFFKKVLNNSKQKNLIYKSDTQGFDEILILSLKKEYLKKIKVAVLEISNFNYLKKNKIKFIEILNEFSIIKDENGNDINKNQFLSKLKKKVEFNLLLSKC